MTGVEALATIETELTRLVGSDIPVDSVDHVRKATCEFLLGTPQLFRIKLRPADSADDRLTVVEATERLTEFIVALSAIDGKGFVAGSTESNRRHPESVANFTREITRLQTAGRSQPSRRSDG